MAFLPFLAPNSAYFTVGSVSFLTMSNFASLLIENRILLTVILIDAALLAIALSIAFKNCSSASSSYVFACLVFAVLLFLFLQDQVIAIHEPSIETFQTTQQRNS